MYYELPWATSWMKDSRGWLFQFFPYVVDPGRRFGQAEFVKYNVSMQSDFSEVVY